MLFYRNPHNFEADVIKVDLSGAVIIPALAVILALLASGFSEISADATARYYLPCPVGTFSNFSFRGIDVCTPCPPSILYASLQRAFRLA